MKGRILEESSSKVIFSFLMLKACLAILYKLLSILLIFKTNQCTRGSVVGFDFVKFDLC